MSTSRVRKMAVVTAKPIPISTAIAAIATSTTVCASGLPGMMKYQTAAAATMKRPSALAAPRRRAPASAKSEQRVRDILRVGREVFSERGYEHATTTEIAQRLG